jgi:hypothetical protein
MANRLWSLMILAGLLTWQAGPLRAEDPFPSGRDTGWFPAQAVPQDSTRQDALAGSANWSEVPVRLPQIALAIPAGAPLTGISPASGQLAMPEQTPNGGWRGDAGTLANSLPGQEGNSGNLGQTYTQHAARNQVEIFDSKAYGRLTNSGRPLVNCHVVIVPIHEEKGTYRFDEDRQALTTVTDIDGVYRFESVAPGEYKLMWLPEGQTRWIRRIALRPDIKVHRGETTNIKEIRIALQTIN